MPTERLQKFLARCGVASRRSSEELIRQGRVEVDGNVVTELGTQVDPNHNEVKVNGKVVRPQTTRLYYMLHKPGGYITTVADEYGRQTVFHLLPPMKERLFPVGRLDSDTEGLLLLTNDGEFALHLTHPRFALDKEYLVEVEGNPTQDALNRLRKGVLLEGKETAPAEVGTSDVRSRLINNRVTTWLTVTIHEGRKRQIRRMFDAVGHRVNRLIRVRVGPLRLGELPVGTYRQLTNVELKCFTQLWSEE